MRSHRHQGITLCVLFALVAGCSGGGGRRGGGYYPEEDDGGGGGGGDTPDLAMEPEPDLARVEYPAGPYGNQVGDTLADFTTPGYRLSTEQQDSTQLEWDTGIKLSDFHAHPDCKCLLITWGALWCGACQQEQPQLVRDVAGDSQFCVLNILQEGAAQGPNATKADVDRWTQRYQQNYYVVQGSATTRKLWNGHGPTIGLPFNFIVTTEDMQLRDVVQGYTPQIRALSMQACGL